MGLLVVSLRGARLPPFSVEATTLAILAVALCSALLGAVSTSGEPVEPPAPSERRRWLDESGRWGRVIPAPVVPAWAVAQAVVVAAGLMVAADRAAVGYQFARFAGAFLVMGLVARRLSPAELRAFVGLAAVGVVGAAVVAAVVAPGWALIPIRAPLVDVRLGLPGVLGSNSLAVVGVMAFATGLVRRGRAGLVVALASAGVVVATQIRSALVLLVVVLVVWLAAERWRPTWRPASTRLGVGLGVGLGLGAVIALVAVPGLRATWDREAEHPEAANLVSYRQEIFEASLEVFADSPLIGAGLGSGDQGLQIPIGRPDQRWASHSEWGTALAATGLVGAGVVGWAYVSGVRAAHRAWTRHRDWLPAAVMAAMVVATPTTAVLSRVSLRMVPYLIVLVPLYRAGGGGAGYGPAETPGSGTVVDDVS